jgi:hypothetical protein
MVEVLSSEYSSWWVYEPFFSPFTTFGLMIMRAKDRYPLCTRQVILKTLVRYQMAEQPEVGEFLLSDAPAAVMIRPLAVHTAFILFSHEGDVGRAEEPDHADMVPQGCVAHPDLAPDPECEEYPTNGACGLELLWTSCTCSNSHRQKRRHLSSS